jgi:hypothetical protein
MDVLWAGISINNNINSLVYFRGFSTTCVIVQCLVRSIHTPQEFIIVSYFGLHSSPFDFILRLRSLCCVYGWHKRYIFLISPFLYQKLAFMCGSGISLCKICFPTFKVTLKHLNLTTYGTSGGVISWPYVHLTSQPSIFFFLWEYAMHEVYRMSAHNITTLSPSIIENIGCVAK